jgi:LysM repeat protein
MKIKFILLTTFYFLLTTFSANAQKSDSVSIIAYIKQYKDIAIAEMKRSGIPASITLAQGIHESSFGTSYLAKNTNNHFGIKCKENWTGKKFKYTDDAPNECFRVYDNVEDSYKDHSDFLRNRPYYAALFKLDITDYKNWAYGLKKAGYATNPKYAPILIKTIEDYQLYVFDKGENPSYLQNENSIVTPAIIETPKANAKDSAAIKAFQTIFEEKKTEVVSQPTIKTISAKTLDKRIVKINKKKAIQLNKNESLPLLANALHISEQQLMLYNDVQNSTSLKAGDYLFLQKKMKKNKEGKYTVKKEDNIWKIAQKKGIQLASLLKRNKLNAGEEPAPKSVLVLKGKTKEKPTILSAKTNLKNEIKSIVKDSIVRANDTIYPTITEPVKAASAIDSSKLLSWEADTKLLEKQKPVVLSTKEEKPAVFEMETNEINTQVKTPVNTAVSNDKNINEIKSITNNAFYTVVKGDTLYNISKRFNISIAQIMEWNQLSEQSIKLGQVLKIQQ